MNKVVMRLIIIAALSPVSLLSKNELSAGSNQQQTLEDFSPIVFGGVVKSWAEKAAQEAAQVACMLQASGDRSHVVALYAGLRGKSMDDVLGDVEVAHHARELFGITIANDGIRRLFGVVQQGVRQRKPEEERVRSWRNFLTAYSTVKTAAMVERYFRNTPHVPWVPHIHEKHADELFERNSTISMSEVQSKAFIASCLLETYACHIHHTVDPELHAHDFDEE